MKDPTQTILACRACSLCENGNGPVSFRGYPGKTMIVGEAPGKSENEAGMPFVGRAGKFLWEELRHLGVGPSNFMVANAVCCFPSRTPHQLEIEACNQNLMSQIAYCDPKYILALGLVANKALSSKDRTMKEWRERGWYKIVLMGMKQMWNIEVFPTYHPAAVLRNRAYTRAWRSDLWAFADVAF